MKKLQNSYVEEQEAYVQSKIDIITRASANKKAKLTWDTVNEISGRKSTNKAKIRAKDDNDRLQKWQSHFSNLLGKTPTIIDEPIETIVHKPLNIHTGNFTMKELQTALTMIPNGKACGLDQIPAEVWKSGALNTQLLELSNLVYNQQKIQIWLHSCILPFPKKGDLGITANYRGISLIPIAAKIYNRLLLNRIQPEIEKVLRPNQNGFRKGRGTISQILTIRRIIEGVKAKQLPAILLFVDFRRAFDSIHRDKMKDILLSYGIPKETVSAIMIMYNNTRAQVRSPDGDTEFFDVVAGVLQGDTLAPFLFIICLDYALRTSIDMNKELGFTLTKSKSKRHGAVTITDCDFADDLALLADTIADATQLLHLLEKAAAKMGLYINTSKTECLPFHQEGQTEALDGTKLKNYLTIHTLKAE